MEALLVPIKAFWDAKLRLAPVLAPAERSALARELAAGVLAAAPPLPAYVVCDDHDVAAFAESRGATVIWTPGRGLSGAVASGVAQLAKLGFPRVVVAHADLPAAHRFDHLGPEDPTAPCVRIVPDLAHDGTNVISLPSASGFRPAYGRGSFARHVAEARRLGLTVEVVEDPGLAVDLDDPADLARIGR